MTAIRDCIARAQNASEIEKKQKLFSKKINKGKKNRLLLRRMPKKRTNNQNKL